MLSHVGGLANRMSQAGVVERPGSNGVDAGHFIAARGFETVECQGLGKFWLDQVGAVHLKIQALLPGSGLTVLPSVIFSVGGRAFSVS